MNLIPTTVPPIALTTGEPAGIGPEISLSAAWSLRHQARCVLLGNAAQLASLADEINPLIRLSTISALVWQRDGLPDFEPECITVIDCPLINRVVPGCPDPSNAQAILHMLDLGIEGTLNGQFGAIATAPLQKSLFNKAGIKFSGHTEYLAEKTATKQVVMMLAGPMQHLPGQPVLRVALATTHIPLKDVAHHLSRDGLLQTLTIINHDLKIRFGIKHPRILVSGLNPHAGEDGYLGREEIEIIAPALDAAKRKGIQASGPLPADSLFQEKYLKSADCVLAMYHDQGLPVLKFASFRQGINITLGLPIIRTSVDHGTALQLAAQGVGRAQDHSMRAAIFSALALAQNTARIKT